MKRCFLLFISVVLILSPAIVSAEDDTVYTEGFFYYTVRDQSITIIGYFGSEEEVTVPASIAGIPVNAIGPNAFAGTTVQILHLPDTITELGENATGDADVTFMGPTSQPAEQPQATAQPGTTDALHEPASTGTVPTSETAATAQPAAPSAAVEAHTGEEVHGAEPRDESAPVPSDNAVQSPNQSPSGPQEAEAAPSFAWEVQDEQVVEPSEEQAKPEAAAAVSEDQAERHSPTWIWILLGGVVAAGTAAIILAVNKRRRD